MAAVRQLFLLFWLGIEATSESLDDDARKVCIDEHNKFRSELALGRTINADGDALPKAADMNRLVSDDWRRASGRRRLQKYGELLETSAVEWAARCKFEHTPNTDYGQNLFITSDEQIEAGL